MKYKATRAAISGMLLLGLAATPLLAGDVDVPLKNWAVGSSGKGLSTMADVGNLGSFQAMTPCRVADTRTGMGFTGAFGPPALPAGGTRTLNPQASVCAGIPAGASAYSLNFTVIGGPSATPGSWLTAWPAGGTQPNVSTLNYGAGEVVANAAVVPAGTGNAISVFSSAGFDVIIDINGYYTSFPNTGKQLVVSGTMNGAAAMVGYNYSNTDGSHGVGGYAGGTGVVHGVQGQIGTGAAAGSSGVHGVGAVTSAATAGVYGETAATTDSSAGVLGWEKDTGGNRVYGVLGRADSTSGYSAGVWGVATTPNGNAGRFDNTGATPSAIVTYLSTVVSGTRYALYNTGDKVYCGSIQTATKNFVAPHPEDAAKEIVYTSVEAPTADIYFRGTARLVDGAAVIQVPDHFRLSARADSYATTVTAAGSRTSVWVESEGPAGIVLRGTANTAVHYLVFAERDGMEAPAIRPNEHFTAEALSRGDVNALPQSYRAALVKNGTLNPDLSLNRKTADRLGWVVPEGVEAK